MNSGDFLSEHCRSSKEDMTGSWGVIWGGSIKWRFSIWAHFNPINAILNIGMSGFFMATLYLFNWMVATGVCEETTKEVRKTVLVKEAPQYIFSEIFQIDKEVLKYPECESTENVLYV